MWNLLRLSVIARHHSVARARVGQVPALTARIRGFLSRKVTSIEMPVCSSRAERRFRASKVLSRAGRRYVQIEPVLRASESHWLIPGVVAGGIRIAPV
jgi:hypothetical protein